MMDYSSVLLVLIIGSCTHSTGDSLFYYQVNLIVNVIIIVFLITVAGEVRENEPTTETSEVLFPCCRVNSLCLAVPGSVLLIF